MPKNVSSYMKKRQEFLTESKYITAVITDAVVGKTKICRY